MKNPPKSYIQKMEELQRACDNLRKRLMTYKYKESDMDNAYDKGLKDGLSKGLLNKDETIDS